MRRWALWEGCLVFGADAAWGGRETAGPEFGGAELVDVVRLRARRGADVVVAKGAEAVLAVRGHHPPEVVDPGVLVATRISGDLGLARSHKE